MTALVEVDEFADWISESTFDEADLRRAEAVLEAASALVLDFTGPEWTAASCPATARFVVMEVATRVFTNPHGVVTEDRAGVLTRYRDDVNGEIELSDSQRSRLRQYMTAEKRGRGSQIGIITTTRGGYVSDTIYVPTDGGSLFPWYSTWG